MRMTLLIIMLYSASCIAQEIPINTEQQLENMATASENEAEDDSYLPELEQFIKNPIDLNSADAEDLRQLKMLNELQIASLIAYRELFGLFSGMYELQAIPSWDIGTIRRVLPFITTAARTEIVSEMRKRLRGGEHIFLLRISQVLERAKGYENTPGGKKYAGSVQQVLFKYKYVYKNLLQFGMVGEKDAGERFFSGEQKTGFDFYSFHLFLRKAGIIEALAIGDFTVSMGQGLILWQGMGFKKSGDAISIKRQSQVLRPYHSAGEFYFNRGLGITIKKGKINSTIFLSGRKLSANLIDDTLTGNTAASSFLTSGYHRTVTENEGRNNLSQLSFGSSLLYRATAWQVGIHGVGYRFSFPLHKSDEPYNLYAINDRAWYNIGMDYSMTWKNVHFFGEAALDKRFNKALLNGVLISLDAVTDIAILQRMIAPAYRTINGNAFTENTAPENETGIYAGISIHPGNGWRMDVYADFFKFPWLKYLIDAPSYGKEYSLQLIYTPDKKTEIITRFRNQVNFINRYTSISDLSQARKNWRIQINYKINKVTSFRNRNELLWYGDRKDGETGFLSFIDLIYKPLRVAYSGTIRFQYFETSGYDSRIYAYENDVLYSYAVPAFFDKGIRYYLLVNYDVGKKISCWLRWGQIIYKGRAIIGSGSDEIRGNRKSEMRIQAIWSIK